MRQDDSTQIDLITEEMIPPRRLRDNVRLARQTLFIKIPPGSKPQICSCGDSIYWSLHPTSGKPHPVSIKHVQAVAPTSTTCGEGISHIPDCPDRDLHLRLARMRRSRNGRR